MHTKIVLLTLLTALVGTMFTSIASAQTYSGSLPQQFAEYHLRINEITNIHFNALFEHFDEKNDLQSLLNDETKAKITAPEVLEDSCPEGDDMNFSATCLAYKLDNEFRVLVESIQGNLEKADAATIEEVRGIIGGVSSIGLNNNFADEQIEIAANLQNQTIAFYRQTLFAYPLHTQYEITLEELNIFLSHLKDIENELANYPSKFHDATTTECL